MEISMLLMLYVHTWVGTYIGNLENNLIICPVHGSQYDITTGKLVKDVSSLLKLFTGGGSKDLTSFPVTVKDNAIYIDLS